MNTHRPPAWWPHRPAAWWPLAALTALAALTILAAVVRLATIDQQSFWYDEAFTPVHVLHPSLWATLRSVVHTENTPPLWYVIVWADSRVLGTGEVALRLPSALAGVATVPVVWAIGKELTGRRATAAAAAAFVTVNPIFVWYSQEARAYALFVLMAAVAMWCFLRALREPTARHMAEFALAGALALLSHYFAVFLLIPMGVWLLWGPATRWAGRSDGEPGGSSGTGLAKRSGSAKESAGQRRNGSARGASGQRRTGSARGSSGQKQTGSARESSAGAFSASVRRRAWPAVGAIAVVGVALLPLISAQGGHGTQWIGEWALGSRLQAVPQYYLTGYYGSALGHGIELLVALPIIAGVGYGLWRVLTPAEERGALIALAIAAGGILIPLVMALLGADYLAPRNLVGSMVPVTALIAVIVVCERAGRVGVALAVAIAVAGAAITLDTDLSPRLQRGNWRDLAKALSTPIAAGGLTASSESAPVSHTPASQAPASQARASRAPASQARASQARASKEQTAYRGRTSRAIVTVELGAAPLEYYMPRYGMPPLHDLAPGRSTAVSEIDEVGYAPLRSSAGEPPAPGFRLVGRVDVDGLIAYRFVSSVARAVSESALRSQTITATRAEVLVGDPAEHRTDHRRVL